MKKLDKLFKLCFNKIDSTLEAIKCNSFKKARNYAISTLEKSRKQYYQNYFQKCWKELNQYLEKITVFD